MARKSSRSSSNRKAVRKTTTRKKKAKSLPLKKWIQAIRDSETGGQDVADKKNTTQQRRGGL